MSNVLLPTSIGNFLYLSIGSILGSWLRFYLVKLLIFPKRYISTLFVNILSTFFLGIILSLKVNHGIFFHESYFLFLSVGFLASLSTFSTFVLEICEALISKRFVEGLFISLTSVIGGIFFASIGYQLARG